MVSQTWQKGRMVDDTGIAGSIKANQVYKVIQNSEYDYTELVTSPKVREHVRKHFACPDLAGAQLVPTDTLKYPGSHWDPKLFYGDIMTGYIDNGTYHSQLVASKLTLSFMEDTGW